MRNGHQSFIIEIDGKGSNGFLNESGGHRIQRIPLTERNGRIHSSTVTVAVISECNQKTIYDRRDENDFKIEWYSGTGCGGQFRNKHANSARVIHMPTGLIKTSQTRSRENSLQNAMEDMNKALDESGFLANGVVENNSRRLQLGSGERSDRRRTYRFQDGLVHDHTNNRSAQISKIIKGNFRLLW